ncbi:MAG: Rab family GTPase [Candidatus Odinarchaeota archaeon]
MSWLAREKTLKLVLLGDGGVGKTSIIKAFVNKGSFQADYKLTIGIDISTKAITLPSGENAIISIHDIAGQKRFESIRKVFYRGTHLAMLVYDVTREITLKNLERIWLPELESMVKTTDPLIKLLIGNKNDLDELRMITPSEGERASKRLGCITHIETSAKSGTNISNCFILLTEQYLKQSR